MGLVKRGSIHLGRGKPKGCVQTGRIIIIITIVVVLYNYCYLHYALSLSHEVKLLHLSCRTMLGGCTEYHINNKHFSDLFDKYKKNKKKTLPRNNNKRVLGGFLVLFCFVFFLLSNNNQHTKIRGKSVNKIVTHTQKKIYVVIEKVSVIWKLLKNNEWTIKNL